MMRWLIRYALRFGLLGLAAGGARGQECHRVDLKLDPRLTPRVVREEWGSGNAQVGANAILELRGCKGELVDQLALSAPLARLDRVPLRGAPAPTYLVSVDLTVEAGSYNGPLTLPVEVKNSHLQVAKATGGDGRQEEIHLALTGKAAWKKVVVGPVDDLVSVSCQPQDGGFVTSYRRYHPTPSGWKVRMRSKAGLWESDGDFPRLRQFP